MVFRPDYTQTKEQIFESDIIQELCHLLNTKKSRTTIYHPMGNSTPERFNRSLLNMLGTLNASQKQDWKKYVPSLVYAYNSTPHESTNVSPFELMFGRKPKLPIDSMFEQVTEEEETTKSVNEYIEDLKKRMTSTREIVKEFNDKARAKQKEQYDIKAKAARINIGDTVLVKILRYEGKHKIADKFEEEVYEVIDQPIPDVPVFKLRSIKSKKEKTLHRNHLHPVNYRKITDDADTEEYTQEKDNNNREQYIPEKEDKNRIIRGKEKERKEKADVGNDSENEAEEEEFVLHTNDSGDAHIPTVKHVSGASGESETSGISGASETSVISGASGTSENNESSEKSVHSENSEQIDINDDETVVIDDDIQMHEEDIAHELGQEEYINMTDSVNTNMDTGTNIVETDKAEGIEKTIEEMYITTEDTDITTEETHITNTEETHVTNTGETHIVDTGETHVVDTGETHIVDTGETHIVDTGETHVIDTGETHITTDNTDVTTDETDLVTVQTKQNKGAECTPEVPAAPKPAPRRSTRDKKPPSKYEDYYMNAVVPRPYDSKIQAVDVLMKSGILNQVDTAVAHKLLEAIMK
ncbi:myb-like protein X [Ruditapes philippinarum]|uniref:myb-like protein X n=1 Tax=Ruditapes philippinarum TaxID=129788 RepID=UPI00295A625E|nr:myb-like protein X [Ruditapes philippinarum]XP_060585421.1 myb-like protein X [Ruditapes philippinarum]